MALQRYQKSVSDYQCTFTKQERIRGQLGQEQQIQVRFREMPFSVLMEWTRNAGDAKRVLYVQGQWQNNDGEDLAKIEPQGAIARLLVRSVALPICGSTAKAQSRRTIDKFGFGNALKLIIDYAAAAVQTGQGSWSMPARATLEGRPTWVLKRTLPYTADGGEWPDRVLIVHIDREWLLAGRLLHLCRRRPADDARQVRVQQRPPEHRPDARGLRRPGQRVLINSPETYDSYGPGICRARFVSPPSPAGSCGRFEQRSNWRRNSEGREPWLQTTQPWHPYRRLPEALGTPARGSSQRNSCSGQLRQVL